MKEAFYHQHFSCRLVISSLSEGASKPMVKEWLTYHWTWFHVRGIRDFTIATKRCNSTPDCTESYSYALVLPEEAPFARGGSSGCTPGSSTSPTTLTVTTLLRYHPVWRQKSAIMVPTYLNLIEGKVDGAETEEGGVRGNTPKISKQSKPREITLQHPPARTGLRNETRLLFHPFSASRTIQNLPHVCNCPRHRRHWPSR
jgi:hypothetical protein